MFGRWVRADGLLTLSEWDALPEDTTDRYELVDGRLCASSRPGQAHQWALGTLSHQLHLSLPVDCRVFLGPEILLFDNPSTVRVPDLVVVPASATCAESQRFVVADVLLACEVVTGGSASTDRVTKFAEYADAGIRDYWIVDPRAEQVGICVRTGFRWIPEGCLCRRW